MQSAGEPPLTNCGAEPCYVVHVGHGANPKRVMIKLATYALDEPEVRAFLTAGGECRIERGPKFSIIVAATPTASLDALETLRRDSKRLHIVTIIDYMK
jgi:hypothetical protein